MPPKSSRGSGNQRAKQSNGQVDPAEVARLEHESRVPITVVVEEAEQAAQAEFEGVPPAQHVTFFGERFALARKVGYLPLLKFAHYASLGTDSASMQGMAAMYEMLRSVFERGEPCGKCDLCLGNADTDPPIEARPRKCEQRVGDEWPRFEQTALDESADDEELFDVVSQAIEIVSSRPTQRRSDSSPRAPHTSARSRDGSRLPAEAAGLARVDDLAR